MSGIIGRFQLFFDLLYLYFQETYLGLEAHNSIQIFLQSKL
ncbi:hypothetical protein NIES4102_24770 [Chondrocystis sp. NIES-4102]|nr:hypothetical protein NIES4102_24770 [Chondrocystis sp. NIES-4102]